LIGAAGGTGKMPGEQHARQHHNNSCRNPVSDLAVNSSRQHQQTVMFRCGSHHDKAIKKTKNAGYKSHSASFLLAQSAILG
jgi:hypothetical protein